MYTEGKLEKISLILNFYSSPNNRPISGAVFTYGGKREEYCVFDCDAV